MSDSLIPAHLREFHCKHCDGKIQIPLELPPTTGPCPHCAGVITSPAYEAPALAAATIAAPVIEATPVATAPPDTARVEPIVSPPTSPPSVVPQPPPYQEIPPTPIAVAQEVLPPPTKLPAPKETKKVKPTPAGKPHRSGLIPILLIILLLGIAIGGVVIFAAREMGTRVEAPMAKAPISDPKVSEANYIRSGWQKEAYQLLRGYMAATDTENKTPFILKGSELSSKIEDFYGGSVIVDSDTPAEAFSIYELSEEDRKRGLFMMTYDQPPQFEMKEFFRPLASLEVQYGVDEADLLLSTLARVGNFAMEPLRVHAFFKKTSAGLKLDWEIFAQTKYRTLQTFVELPEVGQTGVFRVFIVEDVPEKGRAVAGTRTYRIADPANTGDTARINVKIDSEIGRALSLINWRGTKENRPITRTATLALKWTGEPAAPELEISRFICWEFLGLGGQETPATASNK
jgi:hypothetical protein